MKWFKHQTNSGYSAKLRKLLIRYGVKGYGLYYYCIELIAGNFTSENITFELEHDSQILAYDLKMDSAEIEEIIKYCIKLELFDLNPTTQRIIYIGLLEEMDNTMSQHPCIKSLKTSENFNLIKDNLSLLKQNRIESNPIESNRIETDGETKDVSLKQLQFKKPSTTEINQYLLDNNITTFTGEAFFDYYESKGWMIGKNKMKDWKAAVRTWVRNDKKKNEPVKGYDFKKILGE